MSDDVNRWGDSPRPGEMPKATRIALQRQIARREGLSAEDAAEIHVERAVGEAGPTRRTYDLLPWAAAGAILGLLATLWVLNPF